MRAFVLAITVLVFHGSAAADQIGRVKVAVIPGIVINLDAARVDALSQDLAGALESVLDIEAIGGLEVRRKLPVDGLPTDCVARPACVAEVAARVGAQQLLFIVVVDSGTAIQIDSTWLEPRTKRSESRPAIDVVPGTDPKSRFIAAARSLLPHAPVRPKPAGGIDGEMTPAVGRHYTTGAKIMTGVALAGIGVGVGFGLSARSKFNRCDVDPMAPTGCDEEHSGIRTRALVADIGYAVGIAGAITAITLVAISGKESKLIVKPSAEGAVVSAVGRF